MNNVNIVGRIGTIETKELTNTPVTNMSIAIDESYFSKEKDTWVPKTTWINCTLFRESKMLVGDLVSINGRINTRDYVNKNDQKVYVTEVIINNMKFLHRKGKEEAATPPPQQQNKPNDTVTGSKESDLPITETQPDDDLPF